MNSRHRTSVLCLLASLALVAPATGAGFFAPTAGPDGRDATDVAAAPDGDVYAARGNFEMFVLRSGTEVWMPLPNPSGPIRHVQVGPDGHVWAFGWNPTFVSADEGASWQPTGILPQVDQLEFDIVGRPLARTTTGLYRSDDDGVSWTPLAFAAQTVSTMAVEGATFWATVGTTLHRSIDSGTNWTPVATLPSQATALAAHPQGGVYVGLANRFDPCVPGGVFRVTEAGAVSPLGLEAHAIRGIEVQADGDVLLSVGDACSFHVACIGLCGEAGYPDCGVSGVYRSSDQGASWTLVTTQEGVPGKIASRGDGAVFTTARGSGCDLCTEVNPGLLMSPDAGVSWVTHNEGLGKETVRWVRMEGNLVWAANNMSAYLSTDRGATWSTLADMSPLTCAQILGTLDFEVGGTAGFAFEDAVGVHRLWPGQHSVIAPPLGMTAGTFRDMVITATGALVLAAGNAVHIAPTPLVSGFLPFAISVPGLQRLAAGTGQRIAGTSHSATFLSSDAGFTWTQIANVYGHVAFSPDGLSLYVVQPSQYSASLWRMTASNNWLPELVSTFAIASNWIYDLAVDAVGAVYVLENSRVTRLSPGATSWTELDVVADSYEMSFAPDGYLYVATAKGVWRSVGPVGSPTDVAPEGDAIAAVSVGPNPAAEETRIRFHLGRTGPVELGVYDVRGRLVSSLLGGADVRAGAHDVLWRPDTSVPNGVYMYRLHASGAERSGRIVLLRP